MFRSSFDLFADPESISTTGIGRAISLLLAQQGASIVVNYSRSEGPANEVVQAINSSSSERAIAIKANVGSVPEVKQLVAQTVKKFGKVDILVANAGKIYGNKALANTTEADFDEAFDLNVKGVFFLVQVRFDSIRSFDLGIRTDCCT